MGGANVVEEGVEHLGRAALARGIEHDGVPALAGDASEHLFDAARDETDL